jgi:hypothetical protein
VLIKSNSSSANTASLLWLAKIPQAIHLTKQTSVIEIQAQRFPEQRFYSRGKTSFSQLAEPCLLQQC